MSDERRLFIAIHSNNFNEPEETFEYIFNKYKPLLLFVASKYLNNMMDIEDVVQETFIEFFNDVENIRTTIKSYLTTSCKHNALDFLKKNKKFIMVEDDTISKLMDYKIKENNYSYSQLYEVIKEMQCILSNEEVEIILLHLVDDLKFEDVALKLKLNVKTVKTKYYRALKKSKRKGEKDNEENRRTIFD